MCELVEQYSRANLHQKSFYLNIHNYKTYTILIKKEFVRLFYLRRNEMNDYLLRLLIQLTNEVTALKTKVAAIESEKKQQEKELNKLLKDLAQTCVPETGEADKK